MLDWNHASQHAAGARETPRRACAQPTSRLRPAPGICSEVLRARSSAERSALRTPCR
jgi:hypothetical protein